MPNKDSFTFSDKLKKSKSLPLSKRIPSKVGGDGKAKRTLIQRAQRDLPFIIVAAAALLLLPILSRDSGTGYVDAVDGRYDGIPIEEHGSGIEYGSGLGGSQDLAPSTGFRNPLDLIIRKSGDDEELSGMRAAANTGFDDEDDTPPVRSTPTYTAPKPRATQTYAPAAKQSVRRSVVRKPTEIKALRNSKTIGGGPGGGVTRTLAIGTGARSGGASSPREGVRPVALQPMASAGRGGRSMTGENLYAEAARSAGAMNRGPSKGALFDAQLRNVDGSPLGAGGMGPIGGAGSRPGTGGAPSNKNSYKPQLPWWWDFEKQKLMKMWELWNYNFQKAASDAIIKVATGLALCLATGSEDGSVKKFLGEAGGKPDYACFKDGKELDDLGTLDDLATVIPSQTSGSGKDKEEKPADGLWENYKTNCAEAGGVVRKTSSKRKNMLDVRLRCLGLKYKDTWLGRIFKKAQFSEREDCFGMSSANGEYRFELISSKKKYKNKMGHYVVGKKKASPEETSDKKDQTSANRVIYLARGAKLDGRALREHMEKEPFNQYSVVKIVGFTAGKGKLQNDDVKILQEEVDRLSSFTDDQKAQMTGFFRTDPHGETVEFKNFLRTTGLSRKYAVKNYATYHDFDEFYAHRVESLKAAKRLTKLDPAEDDEVVDSEIGEDEVTNTGSGDTVDDSTALPADKEFESKLTRNISYIHSGRLETEAYVKYDLGITIRKECPRSAAFIDTVFNPLEHSKRDGGPKVECGSPEVSEKVALREQRKFSVTIQNPGKCVYAVMVEASGITEDPYVVKEVFSFQKDGIIAKGKKEGNTYSFVYGVGYDQTSTVKDVQSEVVNGYGYIYWITNDECAGVTIKKGAKLSEYSPYAILGSTSYGGHADATCYYGWGCTTEECGPQNDVGYCLNKEDNQIYPYKTIDGQAFRTSDKPVDPNSDAGLKEAIKKTAKDSYSETDGKICEDCLNAYKKGLHECAELCTAQPGEVCLKHNTERKWKKEDLEREGAVINPKTCPNCPAFCKKGNQLFSLDDKETEITGDALAAALKGKKKEDFLRGVPDCDEPSRPIEYGPGTVETANCEMNFKDTFATNKFGILTKVTDFDKEVKNLYVNCIKPKSQGVTILIDGHTSYAGKKGSTDAEARANNIALSEARAVTVAKAFAVSLDKAVKEEYIKDAQEVAKIESGNAASVEISVEDVKANVMYTFNRKRDSSGQYYIGFNAGSEPGFSTVKEGDYLTAFQSDIVTINADAANRIRTNTGPFTALENKVAQYKNELSTLETQINSIVASAGIDATTLDSLQRAEADVAKYSPLEEQFDHDTYIDNIRALTKARAKVAEIQTEIATKLGDNVEYANKIAQRKEKERAIKETLAEAQKLHLAVKRIALVVEGHGRSVAEDEGRKGDVSEDRRITLKVKKQQLAK